MGERDTWKRKWEENFIKIACINYHVWTCVWHQEQAIHTFEDKIWDFNVHRTRSPSLNFLKKTLKWVFDSHHFALWCLRGISSFGYFQQKKGKEKMTVKIDVLITAGEGIIWDSPNQLLVRVATITVIKSSWGLHWELSTISLRNCHLSVKAFSSKLVFPQRNKHQISSI